MKKYLFMAVALVFALGCSKPSPTPKDVLVKRLFTYAENGQIAYGHQDDLVYGHSWCVTDVENDPLERSDIKAVSGKYPALVGFDLGGIELAEEKNLDGVPFDLMRRAALKHIERGGMVTFSWHPRNPLTGGDAWDISSAEVVKSVLPGGEKNADFRVWLQRAADFVESLGDVAVIFRPWHENTGSWFWWGEKLCSNQEYQELFRMTWLYFVKERGLTNILWCYSPGGDAGPQRSMDRYPGDEFIDIIAVDSYEFSAPGFLDQARVRYQEELKSALAFLVAVGTEHHKLIALSETGLEGLQDLTWWTGTLYPAIKDFSISYVLTWRNAWDKPGHFYAPWDGFEGAADFKAFSELEDIVLLD